MFLPRYLLSLQRAARFGMHALLLLCASVVAPQLKAQVAQYTALQQTVASGVSLPSGVAVDAAGNIYIAAWGSSQVLKASPTATGYGPLTPIGSGWSAPALVAVDSDGNVFVAQYGRPDPMEFPPSQPQLIELPANGDGYGSPVTLPVSLYGPSGLYVDSNNNLYVADDNNGNVWKLQRNGSSYAPATLVGNFANVYGIAVDLSGNIYVTKSNSGSMIEISTSGTQTTIATGLTQPGTLAFNAAGDLFAIDLSQGQLYELARSGAGFGPAVRIVGGAQTDSVPGLAVDQTGAVYMALSSSVEKVEPAGADFGTQNVGLGGVPVNITFTFNSTTILGGTAVVTGGHANLDFTDAGGGTCAAGSTYNAGDTCSIAVRFAPLGPGLRQGAAELQDGNGKAIATAYLHGQGLGPMVNYLPGTASRLGAGVMNAPVSSAVDAAGNVYTVDESNNALYKTTPAGNTTQVSTGTYSLNDPFAVAVDGAGDIFVGDTYNHRVLKISASGQTSVVSTGSYSLSFVPGVAVDATGTLYVTDEMAGRILRITAGGAVSQVNTGSLSLLYPIGLALDPAGNLYIADGGNQRVVEVSNTGVASVAAVNLPGAFGVGADGDGNLYVAQNGGGSVKRVAGGVTTAITGGTISLESPTGVTVDLSGNLYITDPDGGQLVKIDRADAPTLNFASAAIGSTSTDNSQTVQLSNYGNLPLVLSSPTSGSNPSYPSSFPINSNDENLCTAGASLATGASCDISASFRPAQTGTNSGYIEITDNHLNQANVIQSIAVTGTGIQSVDHFTLTGVPSSTTAGTTFNMTVEAADAGGNPETSFTGTISLTSSDSAAALPASYTFSTADAGVHTFAVTLKTSGAQTISVQDGAASGLANANVNSATPTVFTVVSSGSSTAVIGSYFGQLTVQLTDAYNNPASGVAVTYASPTTGASTTTSLYTQNTDATGQVSYFAAANGVAGSYQVIATAAGVNKNLIFNLTNRSDSTTTALTTSTQGATYGQPLTLTATVTPNFPMGPALVRSNAKAEGIAPTTTLGPATGSVSFYDGTRLLGTAVLGGETSVVANRAGLRPAMPTTSETAANATMTVSAPAGGTHSYTAVYAGDPNFTTSQTASPVSFTVTQATVTPSLTNTAVVYGQSSSVGFTLTTQVSGPNIALPTGSLTYAIDGGASIVAPVANGGGNLTIPSGLASGPHTIAVTYSGDTNYQAITTPVLLQFGVGQESQTITFAQSGPYTYGAGAVPLSASASSGLPVTFTVTSGPGSVSGSTLLIQGAGSIVVTASQAGNATYSNASPVARTIAVAKAATTASLSTSTTNANLNAALTLTATITSAAGIPTGAVEFLDGSTVLGSGALNAQGAASYTVSTLGAGSHTLQVVYDGDANFVGATASAAQKVTAPDYGISANPSSLTLAAGQTGQVAFTFTPVGGFTGTVNFSCQGLPANASCTFAPASLIADGSNKVQTAQLMIQTEGSSQGTVASDRSKGAGTETASIFLLPGLLLGAFLAWQRKKLSVRTRQWLAMLILMAAVCGAIGCGFNPPHTAAGTSTVTVSASASASGSGTTQTEHTATFTLTITQ